MTLCTEPLMSCGLLHGGIAAVHLGELDTDDIELTQAMHSRGCSRAPL